MGMMIGNKPVAGLVIGDQKFVKDDGWIPLTLGEGVSGNAWFKKSTATMGLLKGTIAIKGRTSTTVERDIFKAPDGVNFVSVSDWDAKQSSYPGGTIYLPSQSFARGFWGNSNGVVEFTVVDNKLHGKVHSISASYTGDAYVLFTMVKSTVYKDVMNNADFMEPAPIKIKE